MPQVPSYGGPQVAADPLRPVQARQLDVSSSTRAIGQGLANLGEGIDRYQETKAQIRANEIETNLTDEYNRWADTEQPKAINQNASTWRSRVESWWEDAKGRYGKDLDPYAARKVTEILARRRSIALNEAGRYQSVQEERYADSTAFSAMESAASSAVRSGAYDVELGRTRDLVYEMAARKNLDKDQRDALMAEQVGKFHRRVIDNLSAEQGLAYYDANAADIEDKRLRDTLERSIEVERKQREAEAEKAKREAEERAVNSAWDAYYIQNPDNKLPPASVMTALPPRHAVQLMDAIEKRAAREAKGQAIPRDDTLYNQLALDINAGETVDLRAYAERLPGSQLDKLQKLQKDLATPKKQTYRVKLEQRMKSYLFHLDDDGKKVDFRDWVYNELEAFAADKKREPTEEERDKILDQGFMQGEIPGRWNDTEGRFFEVATTPELRMQFVPDEIPAFDRQQIIEAYQAKGVETPSEAQIIQLYMKTKAP